MEFKDGPHPGTVPFGEVIVDRHQVDPFAREGIQVHGQGGHQGFSLTGLHLCYLPLVQGNPTDQLYVVMDHIPGDLFSGGIPGIAPYGLVPVQGNIIRPAGQLPVEFCCIYPYFGVVLKAPGSFLHHSEGFREQFQKCFFSPFVGLFLQVVDLAVQAFVQVDVI